MHVGSLNILNSFRFSCLVILCLAVVPSSAAGEPPTYVKAVYSLPVTYDPAQMNDTASMVFSELVYEGLLRFTPTFSIEPALAENWSTDSTGRILTFRLNRRAKFHDGSQVTAADVVSSLTRAVAPGSKVFKYYDCIVGAQDFHTKKASTLTGIIAVDSQTVQITLSKPFPPFAYVLAGSTAKILPRVRAKNSEFFKEPIGSGPFKWAALEKSRSGGDLHLVRFEGYYGPKPSIKNLTLRATDEATARNQAAAGLIHDLANWPLNGTEEVFKLGQHIESEVANTWIVGLNGRVKPFDSKTVRQRFKATLNTDEFRKKFFATAKNAFGYIPPRLPGHQSAASATSLLSNTSATVSGAPIQITIPSGLAQEKQIIAYLSEVYKTAGWNVEVVALEWSEMMKRYENKTLQAFLVAMNVDYPDSEFLLRNFESDNPDNFSGMRDIKFDKLLNQARATQDRVLRSRIYDQLARQLNDNAYTINLFHPRAHYWVNKCVRGFTPNLIMDAYIDIERSLLILHVFKTPKW